MFFKSVDGAYYPISDIQRIGPEKSAQRENRDHRYHVVEMKHGDVSPKISFVEFERIMRMSGALIPASPNTFLLFPSDDGGSAFYKVPVIAWSSSVEENLVPVTVNGPFDDVVNCQYILLPSGHVVAYDEVYDTVEDLQAHLMSKSDRRNA